MGFFFVAAVTAKLFWVNGVGLSKISLTDSASSADTPCASRVSASDDANGICCAPNALAAR
jgi:hypothetical protein